VAAVASDDGRANLIAQYYDFIVRMTRADLTRLEITPRVGFEVLVDHKYRADIVLSDGTMIEVKHVPAPQERGKECEKARVELRELDTQLELLSKRLRNERFTSRAPASVVEAERKKEQDWIRRREHLTEKVKALCGG
jgi:valyl-tRNA synthetase